MKSTQATPELANDEIHVWRASLVSDQTTLRRFESTLADDERGRAQRFIFERDRDRFVAARGILRDLLGVYLGCPPRAIRFAYGPEGKPALASDPMQTPLCFNLSHSHGFAVFAIGRSRDIGIDLELIRPDFGGEDIAKRYFSPKEVAELRRLPPGLREEGFFLCWTRKEAYIKAKGEGLHIALDSFDVSLSPGGPVLLSSADALRWSIHSFIPFPDSSQNFVAALVAEGNDWTPRHQEWKLE